MQFANANGTLTIYDQYLEFIYNPSFTYELKTNMKPNHEPEQIELAAIKTISSISLSMAKGAIVAGLIIAVLGPVATIKGNEDTGTISSVIIFVAVALFIIGAVTAYKGWEFAKLPKAKMKGVQVFHLVPKTEKTLGLSESIVFVTDNEEELNKVIGLLRSKILPSLPT